MKAILEFNLNDKAENLVFQDIVMENGENLRKAMLEFSKKVLTRGKRYSNVLNEIQWKDSDDQTNPEVVAKRVVEYVETKFYEYLENYDVNID